MCSSHFDNLEKRVLFSVALLPAGMTALGDFNGDHKADEVVVQNARPLEALASTSG